MIGVKRDAKYSDAAMMGVTPKPWLILQILEKLIWVLVLIVMVWATRDWLQNPAADIRQIDAVLLQLGSSSIA